jgi:glutamyl/glutaminyl-tRNA synthetase
MRTRIAPTPSGFLHIGNAFSFLLTEKLANENQLEIVLRIDDGDTDRKRPEYVQDIFDTLSWLGISWQYGPTNQDDFEKNWSQQKRIPLYHAAIEQLIQQHLVWACSCSRKQFMEIGFCSCEVKQLDLHQPDTALRMKAADGIESFIVRRRDGIPAYQLSSIVDDLHYGITHIIRGKDLEPSTTIQLFLARKLNLSTFAQIKFVHHLLLHDSDGNKLSKSAAANSIRSMRERGIKASEIRARFESWYSNHPCIFA